MRNSFWPARFKQAFFNFPILCMHVYVYVGVHVHPATRPALHSLPPRDEPFSGRVGCISSWSLHRLSVLRPTALRSAPLSVSPVGQSFSRSGRQIKRRTDLWNVFILLTFRHLLRIRQLNSGSLTRWLWSTPTMRICRCWYRGKSPESFVPSALFDSWELAANGEIELTEDIIWLDNSFMYKLII